MPWFEDAPSADAQAVAHREAQVLAVANRVLQGVGQPPMAQMHELYDTDACWLACWPALDHYPARPARPGRPGPVYLGPIVEEDGGEVVDWPPGEGPRVFVYLRADHVVVTPVLQALAGLRCRAVAVLGGAAPGAEPASPAPHVAVHTVPLATGPMLQTCDVVVGHGGMGLTSSALQAGRPLLLCPTQGEQRATARRVEAHGAAVVLGPDTDAATVGAALQTLFGEAPRLAARAFAAQVRALPAATSTQRAVDVIERLLAGR
jgi:UDP:flavonoid glycosyltransferase YjiC (YdhE family)